MVWEELPVPAIIIGISDHIPKRTDRALPYRIKINSRKPLLYFRILKLLPGKSIIRCIGYAATRYLSQASPLSRFIASSIQPSWPKLTACHRLPLLVV